jgi:Ca-activated chloride channel homolog
MKSQIQNPNPPAADDRLIDALLREHARAGAAADETFLARLDAALDAGTPAAAPAPTRRRRWQPLALAATLALAALAAWQAWRPGGSAGGLAGSDLEMVPLLTEVPAELAVGTPKPLAELRAKVEGLSSRPPAAQPPVAIQPGQTLHVPTPPPPAAPPADPPPAARPLPVEAAPPAGAGFPAPQAEPQPPPVDRERYGPLVDNGWRQAVDAPLSTFSVDVDTAAYANFRRLVGNGLRVPPDAIRLEEMVNAFDYAYEPPADGRPFAVHVANAECPWQPGRELVRVALKGREIARDARPPANLVFLLDVSGSMADPDKLPLVTQSLEMMLEEMSAADSLAIVVYAGAEGLVLPPTACDAAGRARAAAALRGLAAGGSTNGGAGIGLAYQIARDHFKDGGANRVILATDGDFNVGVTDDGGLVRMVEEQARSKVFLTVLGVGGGNLNDGMLEAITNKGNGFYHYLDGQREARRVLLQNLAGTLVTIASDVKIQVEFNPARVRRYRLLGYANRMLQTEDFSNDKVDAGEIGAGHAVTAFYEIEAGEGRHLPPAEALRYGTPAATPEPAASGEWLTVKVRYKEPGGASSSLLEHPFTGNPRAFGEADGDLRFGASVALAAMLLRGSADTGAATLADARTLAAAAVGADPFGRRAEFTALLDRLLTRQR